MKQKDGGIAYYLRHCGNTHYFAALKPYLDYLLRHSSGKHHIVVNELTPACQDIAEYQGYRHLFTTENDLERYDLVLTPTHLRDQETETRAHVVQIFHGISDKPFTYERDMSEYALCLCAGQRQLDRLLRHEHNRSIRAALVGYPKFDKIPDAPRLFDNDKKTLIYCPTWRKGGLSSIENFLSHPEIVAELVRRYNLIVKPHPNLFSSAREFYDADIVRQLKEMKQQQGVKLVQAGNVMPWLAQADLFIGDISASGYEWLYFGKPAVFLNPQPGTLQTELNVDAPTFLWQCGEVCDDIANLPAIIEKSLREDIHHAERESVLHYSVHMPRSNSATARGAAQIEGLLHELV